LLLLLIITSHYYYSCFTSASNRPAALLLACLLAPASLIAFVSSNRAPFGVLNLFRVSTPSVFARRAKSSESFFSRVQSSRRYGWQDCKQRHDAGTCYGGDLSRVYGGG
jgi:hypothetical protein